MDRSGNIPVYRWIDPKPPKRPRPEEHGGVAERNAANRMTTGSGDGTEHEREHATSTAESRHGTSEEEETVEGYILSFTNFHLNGRPPPFQAFLRPAVCERLLEAGWGTRVPYMRNSNVSLEEYSKLFDANGYYKLSGERLGENRASEASGEHRADMNYDPPASLLENEKNSAAHGSIEEKKKQKPEIAERSTLFGSCEEETGEDGRSQVAESNMLIGSCEDKMGGGDSQEVLFGPEDIRDSDSDSFYLEELHSSIDHMEYIKFIDSDLENDTFGRMEDDIFGQMEDDIFGQMEDDFDKVSDDFSEEDDGQQAYGGIENEPSSSEAGKPIEEEADILGDEDVVQVENGIVRHWACANFSYLSQERSRRFLARIVDMCVAIGMEFNPSPINEAQAAPTDIETTLLNLTKCVRKEEEIGILLMILSEGEYSNDKVKEVCAKLGVTFYYCYACEASSPSKGTLKSIAYEIQSKVVMRDARLRRLALPLVSEAPMLIFGADIFRCTPGDDNSDFITSVVTSLDWPKFRRYHIGLSHDEGTINVSARLGSLIGEFIDSFSKRGNGNVEKIILFRNGLKDGQFGDICHQEMSVVKKACDYFIHGYQPRITYVVVLPHASMGMANKSGTGADLSGYTFLCRHSGGKKFSSLACYHVVHDDNDFPPGELQSLTSKLCGIRDRRECPEIDIVPPAYYAKRAGMASLEEWGRTKQLMKFRGTESYLVL